MTIWTLISTMNGGCAPWRQRRLPAAIPIRTSSRSACSSQSMWQSTLTSRLARDWISSGRAWQVLHAACSQGSLPYTYVFGSKCLRRHALLHLPVWMHIPCDKAIRDMHTSARLALCFLGHAQKGREAVRAWACYRATLAAMQACAVLLLLLLHRFPCLSMVKRQHCHLKLKESDSRSMPWCRPGIQQEGAGQAGVL